MSRETEEDDIVQGYMEDSQFLDALIAAGVDNWEGYDRAKDILKEWNE